MSKEGYINVTANPSTLLVFDKFTRELGIKKTAAMTDMLESYMLANNQELYLRLKQEVLHVDAMAELLAQRSRNIKVPRTQHFNALWMRWTNFENLVPDEIFSAYVSVMGKNKNGYCLLGINGPSAGTGFSAKNESHLRELLNTHGTVPLLISVSENLEYLALFDAFECRSEKFQPEDINAIPPEFRNETEKYMIWLRLTSLRRINSTDPTADKIFFQAKKGEEPRSLDCVLKGKGRVPFGYVCI